MQVQVAFRHMETSPAIHKYATDKLHHVVGKYITGENIDSQITFSVEKFRHIANFTININGLTVKSVEKTEDMYSSIDLALDKVERQIRRFKDKIRNHKPSGRKKAFTLEVVAPLGDEEPAEEIEAAESPAIQSLTRETLTADYMNTEQAIMQLELKGGPFLVFTNENTERINIVYRRDDGNFGLIEAEPGEH